jgi:RNA-directed DNA polymerase
VIHTKPFAIPKDLAKRAWKEVKSNSGSCGIDGVTLSMYENNLESNLYKLWNRMSSGSYFPQGVKSVAIPKKQGGERILGIPAVEDRIAQTMVKLIFEPHVEPHFYEDSYGYRANKSALDAISVTRSRCWKLDWVLEYDIKGLFDNIDQELLMKAVKLHTKEKWIILYIERWLKSSSIGVDGAAIERTRGVPQGGVISPILANLFLHYVLDHWLHKHYPSIPWCRYSDDGVLHCKTYQEVQQMLTIVEQRLNECGLMLHPDKTRIVYCKDDIRKRNFSNTSFEFLGYCFRSRSTKSKFKNKCFCGFNPAVSKSSVKAIYQKIRSWGIIRRTGSTLQEIAEEINPILRGWIEYYGCYYATELYKVFRHINSILTKWLMRKYGKLRKHKTRSGLFLTRIIKEQPSLFVHWKLGVVGVVA